MNVQYILVVTMPDGYRTMPYQGADEGRAVNMRDAYRKNYPAASVVLLKLESVITLIPDQPA